MRRILLSSFIVGVFVLSQAWARLDARAGEIQLCGVGANIADSIILSGFDIDGGPFVLNTSWVEFVPTVYALRGNVTYSRSIDNPSTFDGGGFVSNSSEAFGNNPVCAVSSNVQVLTPAPLIVTGSTEFRCVGGTGTPFTVTITFTLAPCDDPGPLAQESAQRALTGAYPAAGYLPNEYRAP